MTSVEDSKEEKEEKNIEYKCRLTRDMINKACNIKEYSNKEKYPYIRYLPLTKPSQEFLKSDWNALQNKQNTLQLISKNKTPSLSEFRKLSYFFDQICKIQDTNNCKSRQETICNVPCYWIEYNGSDIKNGVIFMLHGGGFIMGTAKQTFAESELISKVTGCVCLCITYSLAPENPLPYAVNEIINIYKYCLNELNISSNKIAFNGDSAGGGLALLVVQSILNNNNDNNNNDIPIPSCLWVNSAFTNLSCDFESVKRNMEYDSVLNYEYHLDLFPGWAIGLYDKDIDKNGKWKKISNNDPKNEIYSCVYGNWKGFCPIYFMVGATEVVLDDTLESAKKAFENGVNVKVDIEPYMYHAWPFLNIYPEAKIAIIRGSEWLIQHLQSI